MRSVTVENSATSFALATHNMTVQQYLRMEDEAEYLVKAASQPENAEGHRPAESLAGLRQPAQHQSLINTDSALN